MITALCGGVGGSKLVLGLYRTLQPRALSVIVNTADDLDLWGLHVSPDLDTVTYTLSGLSSRATGWGIEGDTYRALEMLGRFGAATWFKVGDRDLATDVYRSACLRSGQTLTQVTDSIARSLDIDARILPMTDGRVATRLRAGDRWLDFQEYFVRDRHEVPVEAVDYVGIDDVEPSPPALEAVRDAEAIVLVNSNPVLSLLPIISLPGFRSALVEAEAPKVAVSPLVGNSAVSGPAGDLMPLIGCPSDARGVAQAYAGIIDGLIIDRRDQGLTADIERLGVRVHCTDTIMSDDEGRERLARETLTFARELP